MANMDLLKEIIARNELSFTSVAKKLGITYVALNNKLKGKYAFSLEEALALKRILNMTQTEWNKVFNSNETVSTPE